jgi:hypothetical protein
MEQKRWCAAWLHETIAIYSFINLLICIDGKMFWFVSSINTCNILVNESNKNSGNKLYTIVSSQVVFSLSPYFQAQIQAIFTDYIQLYVRIFERALNRFLKTCFNHTRICYSILDSLDVELFKNSNPIQVSTFKF